MLFEGLMKLFKKILALLLTVIVTMSIGYGMNNSETSRNVIYKDRDEVEAGIESYLKGSGKVYLTLTQILHDVYSKFV